MKKFLEKYQATIIIAILAFMTVVSLLNAQNDALIYDEEAHIPAGYSYLIQQDIRLNPEHPPLLKDLAALPLLFLQPKFDVTQDFWTKDNADASQWNAGKYFLFGAGNNPDQIIFWSRLPIILLSLVFGLFIFKWTKEMAGTIAGLFALTLYAFDPNILGHNHFVTTDLGIAAFMTFSFYYFLKFIKQPSWKNVFIGGFFLALVQLTKFSSVLLFPVFGLVLIIYPFVKLHRDNNKSKLATLGEYLLKGFSAFAVSLVLVYIAYFVSAYNMPQTKLPEIISHYFKPGDTRPAIVYTREFLVSINDHPALMPLADYLFGVLRVFQRVGGGNVAYLMGEVNTQGFFAYFPIVFLIKEPLPILFFILFSLIIAFTKIIKSTIAPSENFFAKIRKNITHYLRTSIVEFSMFIFILLYAITSITGKLNIGFRHLFPMLPFIYILVSVGIFRFLKHRHHQSKLIFNIMISGLTIFLVAGTISAYPYYTSYFNSLVSGSKQGYKVATDSNTDWGQDLKRFKIFLADHPGITKIKTDYFGMADLNYYLGDRYEKWWGAKRPIETGWYAISVLFLQESTYNTNIADNMSYRWLKNIKPVYQVGTSILIYNITPQDIQNIPDNIK
ncbi:MAG: glycosyltransferase family 39 protein [Candidatus Moranbacteria bacterium]|nr:glycosyltransferase family 39 protein [Candidatus Moranbacteria bacterium]